MSALESIRSKGGKVSEMNVLNLIDLLINQLLKLDSIMVDEDVKMKREMQANFLHIYSCVSCFSLAP